MGEEGKGNGKFIRRWGLRFIRFSESSSVACNDSDNIFYAFNLIRRNMTTMKEKFGMDLFIDLPAYGIDRGDTYED